jgi:2-dehydropantoate 2-reductase
MKLKYGIIGVGALGGYFGGRLAEAGMDTHFLLHSDYEFVKKNGLKVDSVEGDFHLPVINAYKNAEDMPLCDIVLVCLKTTQNKVLKTILPPICHRNTLVVLVQNGLGIEAQLGAQFPEMNIVGGLAFIGSGKYGPGHIVHTDFGSINVGMFQGEGMALLEQMQSDFSTNKVQIEISQNLAKARWQKLVWNAPYNGLCVIMNCTCDKLQKQPDMRKLVYDIMLEVIEAAKACGATLPTDAADKMLAHTDQMTPYSPSMKLDFDNKREMEIESIYSLPIEEASKYGFEMKKLRILEQQLRFIQSEY